MRCSFNVDRTGFPLLHVPAAGLYVHLLPVTKIQFERFLAEPNEFDNRWYEEVLAANPRYCQSRAVDEKRERLFLTNVLPEEARQFADWLGDGFGLPTVSQWRAVYRALARIDYTDKLLDLVALAPAARAILVQLVKELKPTSLLSLSLMVEGVVEWVMDGTAWVGVGAPRASLHPVISDPTRDTHKPIDPSRRLHFFGFRLVCNQAQS